VSTSLTQLHWLISFWNVIKENAKHLTYRCGEDMELSHQPRFTVWPTYPSICYLMMLSVIETNRRISTHTGNLMCHAVHSQSLCSPTSFLGSCEVLQNVKNTGMP
jgi:hypothetical protein